MHEDALTPAQRKLLETLKGKEPVEGFYLAGGSGLALRLGHRRSLDHDFFTKTTFQSTELQAGIASYHFLKALTYFEDAVDEPLQLLAVKTSWELIKEFFCREVAKIPP